MTFTHRWRRLVQWAGRRERATALALFRIGIGLTVLGTLLSIVVHGLVDVLFVDVSAGGWFALTPTWPVRILGGPTPTTAWILVSGTLVASTALIVGAGGRLAAAVTLLGWIGLTGLLRDAGGSFVALLRNALWLLVLAQSTAILSVDCVRRTGRWCSDARVPAWPRWLAVYQLALMYFTAGLHKVSAHWIPGGDHTALYDILQWPAWIRFEPSWLSWAAPLTKVATVATWCFEVTAPLWLLAMWWHATRDRPGRLRALANRAHLRWWYFGFGVALHLGTWLLLEVGPFSPAALSLYACLLTPDDAARLRASLLRRTDAVDACAP